MRLHILAGAVPLLLGACAAASTPLPDVAALRAPAAVAVPPRPYLLGDPFAGFEPRPVIGAEDVRMPGAGA